MCAKVTLRSVLIVAALACWVGVTQAEIIVSDGFTGLGSGTYITGRSPETNLSNTSWSFLLSAGNTVNTFYGNAISGNPTPAASGTGGQVANALSLDSYGSYTKPTVFTISADISPTGVSGSSSADRGIALGFYSAIHSSGFSTNKFTGLELDGYGSLNLIQDPNASGFFGAGSYTGTPIAYAGGTFSATAIYHLSYQVDTATGHISNIALQGSTADYSSFNSTTLFTSAATKYAGVAVSSGAGGTTGLFDNFQVGTTPEPSALVLMVTGLLGLLAYAWRRWK